MKNIQHYLIATTALLIFSMAACNKVLDRKPEDAISDLNYWQTTDELELYCNNFYPNLYTPDQNADIQSDNCVPNAPNTWLYNQTTVPTSGGGWTYDDWSTVRNANYFLTHYQTATGSQEEIDQYVGEIRFFRAYEYFSKVRSFGYVPWINKDLNINDTSYLFLPRTNQKIVVDSIVEDLKFAAAHLGTPDKLDLGRVHKYAALQMLARVNLYEGTWLKYRGMSGWEPYLTNAAAAAKEVMDNGGYSIYAPEALHYYKKGDLVNAKTNTYATMDYPLPYKEQFIQEDLTSNPECVLPKIYRLDQLTSGLSRASYEANIGASKDLIDAYLCDDGRPIALSAEYKGDDSAVIEFQNRDPRLINQIDNRFLPNYLNGTSNVSSYLSTVGTTSPTGYFSAKYRSPIPIQNEANQTTYDMYIFRYAEVLLIYAEAKAELGTITQGDLDMSINQLRARLDNPNLPGGKMGRLNLTPPTDPNSTVNGHPRYGYAVSPLIYEIRRERRIELAFEGFRWDDIVRWKAGILIDNPQTVYGIFASAAVRSQYNNYFGSDIFKNVNLATFKDWDGKTKQVVSPYTIPMRKWNDKLYLKPIPRDQIILSKGQIKQNPGWDS